LNCAISIEHAVLDQVGQKAGSRQLAGLRKMVEQERHSYLNGDRPAWIRLSAQFHLALAELTGNLLIVETLRRLVSRTTLMIAKNEAPGHNACSFDEHDTVLAALENAISRRRRNTWRITCTCAKTGCSRTTATVLICVLRWEKRPDIAAIRIDKYLLHFKFVALLIVRR